MFEYVLWLDGEEDEFKKVYVAGTPGKAKYQHYLYLREFYDFTFGEFLKYVRYLTVRPATIESLYDSKKEFERMREQRAIPFAYQGQRVEVNGKMGTIVGASNPSLNLAVVFDGTWVADNCHPWWRTKYFDADSNLIKSYCD